MEKNDFHRLDENRERNAVGKRGLFGDVDRPEGGTASGTMLACAMRDRYLCWQMRLTSGPAPEVPALGEHGGERGSG